MLGTVKSAGLYGIEAYPVEVEVNISKSDFGHVALVGLPDTAVKESLERVRAAIMNSGYHYRVFRLTINLAPADLRKEGPSFDLPIAVGILLASDQIVSKKLDRYAITGELALDGRLRPVKGCLSMAMRCREEKLDGIIIPEENAEETGVVEGLEVIPLRSLDQVVGFLTDEVVMESYRVDIQEALQRNSRYEVDFSEVKGQEHVKRALTVAAAGGHNVLMIGPPGAGKSMLAQRLPTILPPMTLEEALETTKVYSADGRLGSRQSLVAVRPFRAPHHTVSDIGLIGGGTYPKPGDASLAHHGVLFLDELPQFERKTLEVLRQPMEDGRVTISRAKMSVTYPAQFTLVCALNPCPCGYLTDPRKECHCTPRQIQQYMSRISGPLLDRIDIQVEVPAVHYRDLRSPAEGEPSSAIRERVIRAREMQLRRLKQAGIFCNARMTSRMIKKFCKVDGPAEAVLASAMQQFSLSARAYNKVLKLSRTIADLDGAEEIRTEHVTEAIQYRSLDRNLWA
jgi:magnesium chelatase family protein